MRKSVPLLRAAAFMLAAALSLPLVQAAEAAGPFSGVPADAWYAPVAEYTVQHGLMAGTDPGLFSPDAVMTRGMLVTILYRLSGETPGTGASFTDVAAGQWYSDGVAWASANNIVGGYGNGLFGPNDSITREQFATILYRYAQYAGIAVVSAPNALTGFTDGASTSAWAAEGLGWAVNQSLITGKTGNLLDPTGQASRAEAAVILQRFLDK